MYGEALAGIDEPIAGNMKGISKANECMEEKNTSSYQVLQLLI